MARNVYGVEADIDLDAFEDGWDWEVYLPEPSVIAEISKQAAKTVLDVIARDAHMALYSRQSGGCEVRVSLGADMGSLDISLAALIADWVVHEGPDEEAHAPLIADLEDALAKVRAVSS